MSKKKTTPNPKDETIEKADLTIDLRELYKYDVEDLTIDITATRYSNLAYVQVSPRDVQIDFLEMPGVKKDGKVMINGTRIYMSHAAAQRLSKVLSGLLKKVYDRGGIEQFSYEKK